ncbi:MAG: chemotaxis protein CheW [Ktedonobacterales bacterium]
MNDPHFVMNGASDAPDASALRVRASTAEALQKALRSFGGGQDGITGETLTPEVLTQIAHRAGITSSAQISELARMMGLSVATADSEGAAIPQHIIFALNDSECTFPAGSVQGIERIGDISTVPNTLPWVLGIVHLRGSILSVVDLRGFLGLPSQPISQRSRLLVVTKREMTIGMVADGVNEMRQLDLDQGALSNASAPSWAAPYAMGTINIDGRAIIMFDPERLLFADRMHRYHA